MNTKDLIQSSVLWKRHLGHNRYFTFDDGERVAVLRLNNFPEEVLFTLINGSEILDLEEKPLGWILEDENIWPH